MKLPDRVLMNAVTDDGIAAEGALAASATKWGLRAPILRRQTPAAPDPAGEHWSHPDVGWGVVLRDDPNVPFPARARGDDAPEAIKRLIAHRAGSRIFRYAPEDGMETLRDYDEQGEFYQPTLGIGPFGTAPGRLPRFLLIVGGPEAVPWRVQFIAGRRHFVGRLALDDQALERYVDHLINEWSGARPSAGDAVVWSTAYDAITDLMSVTIAEQLARALRADRELTVHRLAGQDAAGSALIAGIAAARPALVVTSSHGRTGPLDDPDAMRARLGVPVDQSDADLDVHDLAARGALGGAVWLAYACCSAGSDEGSSFTDLVEPGSSAHRVLQGVGELGASISPLPTLLLSADPPLAAFVGHVEPTFDWSLTLPTGAHLVGELVRGLYPELYRRQPLGKALGEYYLGVNQLYGSYADAKRRVDEMCEGAEDDVVYYALTARDRESLVILGDPTVMVPALPSQGGS